MRYATGGAFRMALEERLAGEPEAIRVRARKAIAFERFLARLLLGAPDRWLVKGAVALEMRFGGLARATKDLDLARAEDERSAAADLISAQSLLVADHCTFALERVSSPEVVDEEPGVRYRVRCELAGRLSEEFVLDVGFEPAGMPSEMLTRPGFLAFAGLDPVVVPALPVASHIAEKLHAYSRTYAGGRRSTRVKDLVDLVIIAGSTGPDLTAASVWSAIDATFSRRATHPVPTRLALPPSAWSTPYRRLAAATSVATDLRSGHQVAARLLDSVLSRSVRDGAQWDATSLRWSSPHEDRHPAAR